jgi:hypothetical protein
VGPRSPDEPNRSSSGEVSGKRQRRKTVTWDERCDVVEFDQDEEEQVEFAIDTEDSRGSDDIDPEDQHVQIHEHVLVDEDRRSEEMGEEYGSPSRDGGRSPSPVLSTSVADTAEDPDDFEKQSINSLSTNNGTATPQMETAELPQESDFNYHNGRYLECLSRPHLLTQP